MSVLLLSGAPVNWDNPPAANAIVKWSRLTTGGKPVIGSLRCIAHLDRLDTLSMAQFKVHISVIQPPFNSGVEASAGTHDFSETFDVWIPGVDGMVQQRFFRNNGAGAYLRTPAQGFSLHIHYFCLPPRSGVDVSDDYRQAGLKVGKYVDGGYSSLGAAVTSSQIADYYNHRNALKGHAHDPSWFPSDIGATIFNLNAYIERRQQDNRLTVQTCNVENAKTPPIGASVVSGNPEIVVLQQAGNATEHLRRFDKYRLFERKRGAEARTIKTMVLKGSGAKRPKWLRTSLAWTGPKAGRRHFGRTFLAVRVTKPFRCWTLNVHFPTGGPTGPNAAAWHEAWVEMVKFTKRRKRVNATGDFNCTEKEIREMAKRAGLKVATVGKVDHSLYKGLICTKTNPNLPGTPNNVHGWGSFTYKKEGK